MPMKKFCLIGMTAFLAVTLSSCGVTKQTGKTADVQSGIQSATIADMRVGDRVTASEQICKEVRRGGWANIRQYVEASALRKAGGADVLLEPQYVVEKHHGLFGSKIVRVEVSGRPAFYSNFRKVVDSVWTNPVFRGVSVPRQKLAKPKSSHHISKVLPAAMVESSRDDYRKKGLAFSVALNTGITSYGIDDFDVDIDNDWNVGLHLGLGYQFSPYVYLGVGACLNYTLDNEESYLPIYGQLRCHLKNAKNAPFVDLKIGKIVNTTGWHDPDGKLYVSPSLGYSFGKFDIAVQYQRSTIGWYDNEVDAHVNHFNVVFGLRL